MDIEKLKNDWRLMNQEKYLMNSTFVFQRYNKYSEDWEHDHCDFCSKKIMMDCKGIEYCTTKGYSTLDNHHWICEDCFDDFRIMFSWTVIKK